MTRILSLGQNNGLTVMILNLAPSRSYHLDTLSSLNFANRTKKIEVNEIENEPIFKGPSTAAKPTASIGGPSIQRQPLRAISVASHNAHMGATDNPNKTDKQMKAFSVYADKRRSQEGRLQPPESLPRRPESNKRVLDSCSGSSRPSKLMRPNESFVRPPRPVNGAQQGLSQELIEDLISRRIDEKLAEKALEAHALPAQALPEDLQKRLDALEQRVSDKEDGSRAEGLQFLLMAKQHAARGENTSALRMYELALPHFKGNEKLEAKINGLKEKTQGNGNSRASEEKDRSSERAPVFANASPVKRKKKAAYDDPNDEDYDNGDAIAYEEDEDDHISKPKAKASAKPKTTLRKPALPSFALIPPRSDPFVSSANDVATAEAADIDAPLAHTPRTSHLLHIINTRDVGQIRSLKGVGAKRAEAIVGALCETDADNITNLAQLGALKGVGLKTVENMRAGVSCI